MNSEIFNKDFQIIAYRGGTETFPENSIEAIKDSLKSYNDTIIEIDLQLTKDNVVIAFHDFELNSLTNGNGRVAELNIEELKKLFLKKPDKTISSDCRIATLEEIFQQFPSQSFVLDLHENNKILIEKVIELVEKYKMENRIAIVSIAKGTKDAFVKIRPKWTFIASSNETKKFIFASIFHLQKFVKINAKVIFIPEKLGNFKLLNSNMIRELHHRNIKVWSCINFKPYLNVNNIQDLNRLKALGVDGVYTDNSNIYSHN